MKSTDLSETVLHVGRAHPVRRVILILIIVLLAAGGFFWWQQRGKHAQTGPTFITEPVTQGDIAITITATGTLEPTNQVTIGSEVSGTVEEVYVDINDRVEIGQKLAKIDTIKLLQSTERSRASLRSAEASVKQASATVKEVEAALNRYRELHELSGGRSPSKADMESSIAALDRAKADLVSAEARVSEVSADLKSNESDLDKAILRSPVDGMVLSRSVEVGQTVAAQFQAPELFVIAEDLRRMDLMVEVAEADIGRIEAGQNATFSVDAWPKRTYTAAVKRVAFGSTNATAVSGTASGLVTYSTSLDVPNDDMTLRPGMTATADIAIAEAKNVLLVSNAALRFDPALVVDPGADEPKESIMESLSPGRRWRRGNRPQGNGREKGDAARVWVLKNGEPHAIEVETGLSDGRLTEIKSAEIEAGTEVIISVRHNTTS